MDSKYFKPLNTKTEGVTRRFDLADPEERKEYFSAKAGGAIEDIKKYLAKGTFVAYLLGKKNSGKGTYTKLFMEVVGSDKAAHVSVGDVVRSVEKIFQDSERAKEKEEVMKFLTSHYRGFIPLSEAISALESRSQEKLLPSELILSLLKMELDKQAGKAVFIDGFPRDLDQVSYALFLRDLMGYRYDPDFFVFINIPESVIDERMKYRVVCPSCQTPRNTRLFATKEVGYNAEKEEFYLKCDNPDCKDKGARMVGKEGDSAGIESIRGRLDKDDAVMDKAVGLEGVPKVFLRNSIPAGTAKENVDNYEITPAYSYKLGSDDKSVEVVEDSWVIKDDDGVDSYSLLAPPVAVSLFRQIADILNKFQE